MKKEENRFLGMSYKTRVIFIIFLLILILVTFKTENPYLQISLAIILFIFATSIFTSLFKDFYYMGNLDYQQNFIGGILLMILGFVGGSMNLIFILFGAFFIVHSLVYIKDWKKNHITWKKASNSKRISRIILYVGFVLVFILELFNIF
ncbi:MAG: hypothetical protein Q8N99_03710 [Nanoarchaeota archaeon]|nr:hypothetical protein [Nanoarchaeota archaeon]